MSETIHLTVQDLTESATLNAEQVRVIEAVSPEMTVERVEGGVKISTKDWHQETSATVYDGEKGDKGDAGDPGHDGVSPTVSVEQTDTGATVTVTDASGTTTANLTNGQDGAPGQDGISPTVTITEITGGHRITITDATGSHSADVMDGEDGQGVPSGGAVGQVLAKASGADNDTVWQDRTPTVSVSGTTPTINALPGVQYVCGEVSTLDITLPASGIVDVVFTSGATPTVLTVTPPSGMTMRWANGFDPSALEADAVYEVNVADGCLGVAGTWS